MSGAIPPGLDPRVARREVVVEASAEHLEKMLHRGQVHGFVLYADEPQTLGGEGAHPTPLDYFTTAVAF